MTHARALVLALFLLVVPAGAQHLQLLYAVGTVPDPLEVSPSTGDLNSATLYLDVSNPGPPVLLKGIIVALYIGQAATDLTNDGKGITVKPADGWKLVPPTYSGGTAKYVFQPKQTPYSIGTEGLTFYFNDVEVNRQPGTTSLMVTEGSGGCSQFGAPCPTKNIPITKMSYSSPVLFGADPANIPAGGSTTLNWKGPPGMKYTVEYSTPDQGTVVLPASNKPPFSNQDKVSLNLEATTTFTLDVVGTLNNVPFKKQVQKTVTVASKPQITSFTGELALSGSEYTVTLQWSSKYADSATLWHSGSAGECPSDAECAVPISSSSYVFHFTPKPGDPLPGVYHLGVESTSSGLKDTAQLALTWKEMGKTADVDSRRVGGIAISPHGKSLFVAHDGNSATTDYAGVVVLDATVTPPTVSKRLSLEPDFNVGGSKQSIATYSDYKFWEDSTYKGQVFVIGGSITGSVWNFTLKYGMQGWNWKSQKTKCQNRPLAIEKSVGSSFPVLTTQTNIPVFNSGTFAKSSSCQFTGDGWSTFPIKVSPDGKTMAVLVDGDSDSPGSEAPNGVEIFELGGGCTYLRTVSTGLGCQSFSTATFSPGGDVLYFFEKCVSEAIWKLDMSDYTMTQTSYTTSSDNELYDMATSADGSVIFGAFSTKYGGGSGSVVTVLDASTFTELGSVGERAGVQDGYVISVSPDGTRVFAAGGNRTDPDDSTPKLDLLALGPAGKLTRFPAPDTTN